MYLFNEIAISISHKNVFNSNEIKYFQWYACNENNPMEQPVNKK